MTVEQLYRKLGILIKRGHRNREVDVFHVDNGRPFAERVVGCERAEKYDGDMVWIYVEEERGPEWAYKGGYDPLRPPEWIK